MSEQSAAAAPLTLPAQIVIEGAIEYPGHLIVRGIVDGDVVCNALTVEERGIVNGSVRAQRVTVMGEVNGEIYANALTLRAACSVTGDIYHNQLVLEDGCYFEGKSRRLILPLESVS